LFGIHCVLYFGLINTFRCGNKWSVPT